MAIHTVSEHQAVARRLDYPPPRPRRSSWPEGALFRLNFNSRRGLK
jgi:hypothetical protein